MKHNCNHKHRSTHQREGRYRSSHPQGPTADKQLKVRAVHRG